MKIPSLSITAALGTSQAITAALRPSRAITTALRLSQAMLWYRLPLIGAFILAGLSGCGDNSIEQGADLALAPDGAGPVDASPLSDASSPAPDAASAARCAGKILAPTGTTMHKIMSSGKERTYLLHVPTHYDPRKPTQALVDLHGFTDTAAGHLKESGMEAHSDERGFLLLAPQGTGGNLASWNAGSCCGPASGNKVEDVVFISDMLAELRGTFCVDDGRVYASGMSNGAFFANRLGCDLADQFAGIAPVSGGLLLSECKEARPVSVMYFHGTGDTIVPYNGNKFLGFPSAMTTFLGWAMRDSCTGMPKETFKNGKASCQTYGPCKEDTEVTLCTIEGGSHSWPGSAGASMDIDASTQLLDFFAKHVRPTL